MSILKKPLITEKMTKAGEKLGQYGFVVDIKSNKIQIKQAIENMYRIRCLPKPVCISKRK